MTCHSLKQKPSYLVLFFVILIVPTIVFADADKTSNKVIENADYYFELGRSFAKESDYQKAIESFKRAIEINPAHADAHYILGLIYEKKRQYKEAIESYNHVIPLRPNDADLYFDLGFNYGKLGMGKKAEESYVKAVTIKPDFVLAHFNLGLIYLLLENKEAAHEEFNILFKLDKDSAVKLYSYIDNDIDIPAIEWWECHDTNCQLQEAPQDQHTVKEVWIGFNSKNNKPMIRYLFVPNSWENDRIQDVLNSYKNIKKINPASYNHLQPFKSNNSFIVYEVSD